MFSALCCLPAEQFNVSLLSGRKVVLFSIHAEEAADVSYTSCFQASHLIS